MQTKNTRRGFTLIEVLVVVLIIAVLSAVALPQYQKAVLKSRFTGMMPIGKTLANANEAYYLQHQEYANNPQDLPVEGQNEYPNGTAILLYPGTDDLSFVRVKNEIGVPNAQYVVYQKHSANFPDTTWCEAGDEHAEEMCEALGGVMPAGLAGNSSGTDGWKAYLLSGQVREGDSFAGAGSGNAGSGTSGNTYSIPAREWDGNPPSCSTNRTGGNDCTYNYTDGETLKDSTYPNRKNVWSCQNGICATGMQHANGSVFYTTFNDGTSTVDVLYDSVGNVWSVTLSSDEHIIWYDEQGNLKTTQKKNIPGGGVATYREDGTLASVYQNERYSYNAEGAPITAGAPDVPARLTEEEIADYRAQVQPYLGKTRCQIYPELQECSGGN